jgi:hypothetical protein
MKRVDYLIDIGPMFYIKEKDQSERYNGWETSLHGQMTW